MKIKGLYKKYINDYRLELLPFIIVGIFILLSVLGLLHKGFFRTIDDVTTVRIMYVLKELHRTNWINNFPVRWLAELSHNYGYPMFVYYGALSYFVGALFMLLGFSRIVSTKIIYFLPFIFGSVFFYLAVRQKLPLWPSVIASCFFTLFPSRGFEIYFRGGVAEAWALNFIPGMFLGVFLLEKNKKVGTVVLALSIMLVIISHQLTSFLALALLISYGVLFLFKNRQFWLSILLGFALSTFYWLPCLYYIKAVRLTAVHFNSGEILDHLAPISSFFNGTTIPGLQPNYPTFIPLIPIFGLLYLFLRRISPSLTEKRQLIFWGTTPIFLYFLLTSYSYILWKITLPITGLFQFPIRVLTIVCFMIPFFCWPVVEAN